MSPVDIPCRLCGGLGLETFLSLGRTPLADALVRPEARESPEEAFSLDMAFCHECSLVQLLEKVEAKKLFVDNYLYFSSFSPYVLEHARRHALDLVSRRSLGAESLVVELASNDGYLLKNFVDLGVPVLGIDPAPGQAEAAILAGVPTLAEFFGAEVARRLVGEGKRADVIVANNVMAHVPDLNDFVEGIAILLADDGVVTIENPYVRDLILHCEFDTIYHEHVCYFSCTAVDTLMRRHGLHLNHVEHFPDLHGGTLRWHVGHRDEPTEETRRYLAEEQASDLTSFAFYQAFAQRVEHVRTELRSLLMELKSAGKTIAAYGAAAKGSTLINYVGIDCSLVDFVVDRNVHKQGLLMPGVHLPIRDPSVLLQDKPDYLLLLAWNFKDEIMTQQQSYLDGGGRVIMPIPEPCVL